MADCTLKDGTSTKIEKLVNFSQKMLPERPKRPLSAYNIFFREARRKILKDLPETRKRSKKACYYSSRTPHGKIGFADLARTIGGMWKSVSPEERKVFDEQAGEDRMRYDKEMAEWKSIMEASKERFQIAEKTGEDTSITMHIDKKGEKIPDMSAQSVSCEVDVHKSQVLDDNMAVHVLAAVVQTLQSNHDIEKLTSLHGFLVHACSTLSKEEPKNITREPTNEKPFINTEEPVSATITDGTKSNDYTGILGALLVYASMENSNVDGHKENDFDPLSPTISRDYMPHYSWLANKMGQESTAFFIDIFQRAKTTCKCK